MYAADKGVARIVALGKGQELSDVDQAHVDDRNSGIAWDKRMPGYFRLLRLHFELICQLVLF